MTSTTSVPAPGAAQASGGSATAPQHRVKRTSSRLMTGGGVRQRARGPAHQHQVNQVNKENSSQENLANQLQQHSSLNSWLKVHIFLQQTLIQCPLCGRQFARNVVEIHAATCEGRTDTDQVPTTCSMFNVMTNMLS